MKIKTDLKLDPSTEPTDGDPAVPSNSSLVLRHATVEPNGAPEATALPFNVWTVLGALKQRWLWLHLAACLGAALGLAAGGKLWKTSYTATVELVRYDSPNARELASERQIASATFASLLRSPQVLRRVSERAEPAISPPELARQIRIIPERDTDVIAIDITGKDPSDVIALANLYADEAVRFTKVMQTQAATEAGQLVTQHLARVEAEIGGLIQRLGQQTKTTQVQVDPPVTSPQQLAREKLNELLESYTDAHPLVQAQRAKLAAMEGVGAASANSNTKSVASGRSLTGGPAESAELYSGQLQSLETARLALSERLRTLQVLQENPPGYYQVLKPAAPHDLAKHGRTLKIVLLAVFGALAGLLAGGALAVAAEALDNRLKDPADVARVTGLPVLASTENLFRMQDLDRRSWAFRVWTNLQWQLTPSPNHSLVCGFTSDDQDGQRFPWVALMVEAASQRGFRVLKIETCPAGPAIRSYDSYGDVQEVLPPEVGLICDRAPALVPLVLDSKMLASPDQVEQHLTGPQQQALLRIPLPGWVWSLQRRNEWRAALQHWSRLGNVVILVDLPPARAAETLLLAESLPNLIWVSDGQKSNAAAARQHVEALRHARCHLAGAVLSHARPSRLEDRFARWVA